MKLRYYSFMAIIATLLLSFSGCKKEESKSDEITLLGRWIFTKVEEKTIYQGQEIFSSSDDLPSEYFIDFKSDGTFVCHLNVTDDGQWVMHEKKLYLSGMSALDDVDDGYDILKLTKNEMQIKGVSSPRPGDSEEIIFHLKK